MSGGDGAGAEVADEARGPEGAEGEGAPSQPASPNIAITRPILARFIETRYLIANKRMTRPFGTRLVAADTRNRLKRSLSWYLKLLLDVEHMF